MGYFSGTLSELKSGRDTKGAAHGVYVPRWALVGYPIGLALSIASFPLALLYSHPLWPLIFCLLTAITAAIGLARVLPFEYTIVIYGITIGCVCMASLLTAEREALLLMAPFLGGCLVASRASAKVLLAKWKSHPWFGAYQLGVAACLILVASSGWKRELLYSLAMLIALVLTIPFFIDKRGNVQRKSSTSILWIYLMLLVWAWARK